MFKKKKKKKKSTHGFKLTHPLNKTYLKFSGFQQLKKYFDGLRCKLLSSSSSLSSSYLSLTSHRNI